MAGKLTGLQRRLERLENVVAEAAERQRLANCICKFYPSATGVTIATSADPEQFEKEMNRTCPVHGFRSLGHIIAFHCVDQQSRYDTRIDEVLKEYSVRQKAFKSRVESQDDHQEA